MLDGSMEIIIRVCDDDLTGFTSDSSSVLFKETNATCIHFNKTLIASVFQGHSSGPKY